MHRTPTSPGTGFKSWMLPVLAVALVVPLSAGFLLGGPVIGFLVALLAVIAVVVVAIRKPPQGRTHADPRG